MLDFELVKAPNWSEARGRARSPLRADETTRNGEIRTRLQGGGAQGLRALPTSAKIKTSKHLTLHSLAAPAERAAV